jgi:alpha-beta hydrolase superfamily lysophospholipase
MQSLAKLDHPEILSLLLQPPRDYKGSCPANADDLSLTISADVLLTCRFYLSAPEAPNVIYFHGGGESSDSFDAEAEAFNQAGINVFLASQRGFGKSTGTPSISALVDDAKVQFLQAIKWLASKDYSGAIIVMGRSLGAVCAIDVVHKSPDTIKAMILESAFCETLPLLSTIGAGKVVEDISEADGFNNLQKIAEIKIPTILFHGSRDLLVPISQAEKLQAASGAKNKQFLIIPGAEHDTVSQTAGKLYFSTIKGFIDAICGVNTWRQRRRKFKSEPDGGNS